MTEKPTFESSHARTHSHYCTLLLISFCRGNNTLIFCSNHERLLEPKHLTNKEKLSFWRAFLWFLFVTQKIWVAKNAREKFFEGTTFVRLLVLKVKNCLVDKWERLEQSICFLYRFFQRNIMSPREERDGRPFVLEEIIFTNVWVLKLKHVVINW